jgi:hypothetical protein
MHTITSGFDREKNAKNELLSLDKKSKDLVMLTQSYRRTERSPHTE